MLIYDYIFIGVGVKPKRYVNDMRKCLVSPGADLVVCDEGHTLKTEKTNLSKSVNQVETRRRLVLTGTPNTIFEFFLISYFLFLYFYIFSGTPLQNNLTEYYCMVSFVKPSLLGTLNQFKNRFVNPINYGQHKDSTEADVRLADRTLIFPHNLFYSNILLHFKINEKTSSCVAQHVGQLCTTKRLQCY